MERNPKGYTLLPLSNERDYYLGFVETSKGESFGISFSCESGGGKVNPQSLRVEPALQKRLKPFLSSLIGRSQQTVSLDSFLHELVDLTEQSSLSLVDNRQFKSSLSLVPATFYELLLDELNGLGWKRILEVDADKRIVTVCSRDVRKRTHELTLSLPIDYPVSAPKCSTDTPEVFVPKSEMVSESLSHCIDNRKYHLGSIIKQWETHLVRFQVLWDQLDDIDEHVVVLEPERKRILSYHQKHPQEQELNRNKKQKKTQVLEETFEEDSLHPPRRFLHRRIVIARHASMLFEFDFESPFRIPKNIRFLGKEAVISPLRLRFGSEIATKWDTSGKTSIRLNLQNCLGIEFPSQSSSRHVDLGGGRQGYAEECAICYTYRLPSTTPNSDTKPEDATKSLIPEVICSNSKCNRAYHHHCLYEWLCGLPNAARSFGTIFGHCPYCFVPISVRTK